MEQVINFIIENLNIIFIIVSLIVTSLSAFIGYKNGVIFKLQSLFVSVASIILSFILAPKIFKYVGGYKPFENSDNLMYQYSKIINFMLILIILFIILELIISSLLKLFNDKVIKILIKEKIDKKGQKSLKKIDKILGAIIGMLWGIMIMYLIGIIFNLISDQFIYSFNENIIFQTNTIDFIEPLISDKICEFFKKILDVQLDLIN